MRQKLFFLLLLASSSACKKNIDFPPDLRPNEFWVQYTVVEETGVETKYHFQGEDTTHWVLLPDVVIALEYFSHSAIQDSVKQIDSGLIGSLAGTPFSVRLNGFDLLTDPFSVPEWTPAELEQLLIPGKTYAFGDGLGEVKIDLQDYPKGTWTCSTDTRSNQAGYFRVLEVEDYGSPEIGVPYFGKKVKISFACTLVHNSDKSWILRDGEAVLFFRYYKY